MTERRRTQVYFTAEQRRALDEVAGGQGRTMAEVVREATATYLAHDARTLQLPSDMAARLDAVAAARGTSVEALTLDWLREALDRETPRPRLPLFEAGWGDGDDARRVDDLLARGFGQLR